jgi:protein-disulfide isomerase
MLATELKIDGSPAFIVGDVMVPGADMPALKAASDRARAARGPLGAQKS